MEKMEASGFCRLARVYRLLETLTFGETLQCARVACLSLLADAEEILVLGEGDGRFLYALLAANPSCRVTVVDRSPVMLAFARRRLVPVQQNRVDFRLEDATRMNFPRGFFDVVVTHFFLDCFTRETLMHLVPQLARCLCPGGRWLLADFVEPRGEGGGARFQYFALRMLYALFRSTCGIEARRVFDPRGMLLSQGLRETDRNIFAWGWIDSSMWEKDFVPESTVSELQGPCGETQKSLTPTCSKTLQVASFPR